MPIQSQSENHLRDLRDALDAVPSSGTHVVLLGTQGGPIPGERAATSSALVVDGSIYIIDAGSGLPIRFSEAGLEFDRVRGMFITHLHSDHYSDYFNFFLLNWTNWNFDEQVVEVFGPGRASDGGPHNSELPGLPEADDTPVVFPELPTPGLRDMTELFIQANAYDINERLRSTRRKNGKALDFTGTSGPAMFRTNDIAIPQDASVANPSPECAGFTVYEDDKVRVMATLVDHPPVFPAFAFRFDTVHGSVVFSGDTSPCVNLIDLAQGADVLVNEVMAVDSAIERFKGTPLYSTMAHQFLSAHTPLVGREAGDGLPSIPGVGTVARMANVKALVLNHIYPGDGSVSDDEFLGGAQSEFDGPVVVGRDLLSVDVSRITAKAPALWPAPTSQLIR
ncbi:MBL fold metallo-hydrolase [Paenarthrobacter sp. NPDC056912]|uniref:MBL fold metallo-hydrolase n=1 Tax=Paenarthrobacter sp. NPDC056912 TaxID=3345965 RepID=UPI00366EBCFD